MFAKMTFGEEWGEWLQKASDTPYEYARTGSGGYEPGQFEILFIIMANVNPLDTAKGAFGQVDHTIRAKLP